jgi:hypothetical protein
VSAIFEALKLEIRRSPLSIYTIAHKAGVDDITVRYWLSGRTRYARRDTLEIVARAIGKRLESLVDTSLAWRSGDDNDPGVLGGMREMGFFSGRPSYSGRSCSSRRLEAERSQAFANTTAPSAASVSLNRIPLTPTTSRRSALRRASGALLSELIAMVLRSHHDPPCDGGIDELARA